jgi:hypothetical protein
MKSNTKILLVAIFLFAISMLIYQYLTASKKRKALLERGKVVTGKIFEINDQGSKYKKSICYTFQVEKRIFTNCEEYTLSGNLESKLIGIYAPVIYDSTNPGLNTLILYKGDFQSYKLNYPDSLKWIEYLR